MFHIGRYAKPLTIKISDLETEVKGIVFCSKVVFEKYADEMAAV